MALSFMKKGKEAKEAIVREEAIAEARKNSNAFRFRLKKDEERTITFVDGDLEDGVIDAATFHEHQTNYLGNWDHFVCVEGLGEEPCPICQMNSIKGSTPATVQVLTIIDHKGYLDRSGNSFTNNPMLFVMKSATRKLLQKIATKRGGLAGCTFDVSRSDDDMSPACGTLFEFVEKHDAKKMKTLYGDKSSPLVYETEIVLRSAKELRVLGFGDGVIVGAADSKAYEDDL